MHCMACEAPDATQNATLYIYSKWATTKVRKARICKQNMTKKDTYVLQLRLWQPQELE